MTAQTGRDPNLEWQLRLNETAHDFALAVRELHQTNPWPEHPVLAQAINTLMTELWDRCFGQTEIRTAFKDAVADLPRYAGGDEVRP